MGVLPTVLPDCQSEEAQSRLPSGASPLSKAPLGSTSRGQGAGSPLGSPWASPLHH